MTDDLRARVLAAIDERLKLCDAATPGPWFATPKILPNESEFAGWNIGDNEYAGGVASAGEYPYYCIDHKEDADFIAASRLGWPASLRFARGEVERHERTGEVVFWCCACSGSDAVGWPCPTILAAAAAFGVKP